jgi:hypothetical protein
MIEPGHLALEIHTTPFESMVAPRRSRGYPLVWVPPGSALRVPP